jgi:4-aminobutyrate aminotransferase/(S)-3-amino-2-methylpropionate transaminase
MPLAAVTGRAEIMDAVHAGGLGGTYGGNPVACAAALGAIRWMEEADANGLAKDIEAIMIPRLKAMAEQFTSIGDIRGRGAMIAIELVRPGSMEPDADLAGALNKYCHAHGVVTLTTGTYGNVFRFLPPLTMPVHLLEEALTVLEQAFEASS